MLKTASKTTFPHVLETMLVSETQRGKLKPKLKDVKDKIKELKSFRWSDAFGFEKDQSKEPLEALLKKEARLEMALSINYPEIDYTFLSWRKKDTKLPAFIVLSLKSNVFRLESGPYISTAFTPNLPQAIQDQFRESIDYLWNMAGNVGCKGYSIEAEFAGVMPVEIRKKTKDALEDRSFDQIFIVAEAPKWKIEEVRRVKGDPLVVGWVEKTRQMFLVASFDTTALEEYVKIQHEI